MTGFEHATSSSIFTGALTIPDPYFARKFTFKRPELFIMLGSQKLILAIGGTGAQGVPVVKGTFTIRPLPEMC